MIKFGPSGRCELCAEKGFDTTAQTATWVKQNNLDCFEYSFGKGVRLSAETAQLIASEFAKNAIEISVHAPYYINLATLEQDKADNNLRYIFDSMSALKMLGGNRCVFHPGSPLKQERGQAVSIMMNRFEQVLIKKHELGFDDVFLCPETMGKKAQIGNLDEIIGMCRMGDDRIVPCIDWGHLNSREGGIFFKKDDYKKVIDKLINSIGFEKTSNMHIHFSKIEYSAGGEVRHLTFDDMFDPPFEPLMEVLFEYKLSPYIVCESSGTQTLDAVRMKKYFFALQG